MPLDGECYEENRITRGSLGWEDTWATVMKAFLERLYLSLRQNTADEAATQSPKSIRGTENARCKGPEVETWSASFFFPLFLGPHMEVPRLGVESEPQLRAYTTATATPDLSRVCNLHHSSQPCWILYPLSGARDRTRILMDTIQVHYR